MAENLLSSMYLLLDPTKIIKGEPTDEVQHQVPNHNV